MMPWSPCNSHIFSAYIIMNMYYGVNLSCNSTIYESIKPCCRDNCSKLLRKIYIYCSISCALVLLGQSEPFKQLQRQDPLRLGSKTCKGLLRAVDSGWPWRPPLLLNHYKRNSYLCLQLSNSDSNDTAIAFGDVVSIRTNTGHPFETFSETVHHDVHWYSPTQDFLLRGRNSLNITT